MKYLKQFEDRKSDFEGSKNYHIPKYDYNDYVEYDDGKILRITDIDIVGNTFQYEGVPMEEWKIFPVDKFGNYQFTYIIEYRINRKLTEEEVELYLNVNKYNL